MRVVQRRPSAPRTGRFKSFEAAVHKRVEGRLEVLGGTRPELRGSCMKTPLLPPFPLHLWEGESASNAPRESLRLPCSHPPLRPDNPPVGTGPSTTPASPSSTPPTVPERRALPSVLPRARPRWCAPADRPHGVRGHLFRAETRSPTVGPETRFLPTSHKPRLPPIHYIPPQR